MTTGGSGPSPEMEQVIGKAIAEPEFRQQLINNPQEAIRSAGINLSSNELQTLQNTSREEREQMLQSLGERTSPWFDGIRFNW